MRRLTRWLSIAVVALGALSQAGCSSTSDKTPPPTPPAAPTGLTATAADTAVGLAWTPVAGATGYAVYRGTATGALGAKTKIASPTSAAYNDTAVSNGTAYFYQVTASNAVGESAGSAEVSATPSASLPPAAPTGVSATPHPSSVTVTWSAVATATSYNLYWSETPGVTKGSGTKITGVTSPHTLGGLTTGTTYYFVVTAQNGNGESVESLEVSATPTAPPPYIVALVIRWPVALPDVPVMEVRICTSNPCTAAVTGATVTVNGTTLAFNATTHVYEASSPVPDAGAAVTVSVTIPSGGEVKAGTYTASGTMYTSAPSVTSPTAATTWTKESANTVTWAGGAPTSTTPASAYVVGIMDSAGTFYPTTSDGPVEVSIGTTSFVLPANSITVAGTYTAWVGIATNGIIAATGSDGIAFSNALEGSGLYLGYVGPFVEFTVN